MLIFSLQDYSSDTPLTIINEHTYGVRAVAFSPDSRYLASLGTTNDGFLYIWAINQRFNTAKLHSSNKCTSVIKQLVWLGNSKIVTVGTRHIKIWRVASHQRNQSPNKQRHSLDSSIPNSAQPLLKTLPGRNVLLGPLVDLTFTDVAAISNHRAIVSSEKGDLCLVDGNDGSKLLKLANTGFSITCIAVDIETRRVKVGGKNGKNVSINLDDLLSPNTPPTSPTPAEEQSSSVAGHICAMGYAGRRLVTVNTNHLIGISKLDSYTPDPDIQSVPFSAHSDAVLGVCLIAHNPLDAEFLTWSANGTIMFWDLNGVNRGSIKVAIPNTNSDNAVENECLNVRVSKNAAYLAYGDRYGFLRVIKLFSQDLLFETKAHSSDVNGIDLYETMDFSLLATCSRDRTVQLYRLISKEWILVQTLDEHTANVTCLLITEDGLKLISSSTDRTVHIRQIIKKNVGGLENIAVIPFRIITLKSSPVSIAPYLTDNASNLIVSLLDRTVATYEISTGRQIMSFKASDNDSIEAVALDSLAIGSPFLNSGRSAILASASSMDKSVRVYDGSTGAFLDREWGHATNVTGIALYERSGSNIKTVISTGSDGTIMIWSLCPKEFRGLDSSSVDAQNNNLSSTRDGASNSRVPLRRVMSKVELAEMQRSSPSPISTGAKSPRVIRKKPSRCGNLPQALSQLSATSNTTKSTPLISDDIALSRQNTRARSRSQPPDPNKVNSRKSSISLFLENKGQKKDSPALNECVTLNMATEQACCLLRTYRRKLLSCESVKDSSLKELDQELRLTAVALAEKSQKSQSVSETLITGLLDEYSERLISMFGEKLRSSRLASNDDTSGQAQKT